jgi:hypothetical protein
MRGLTILDIRRNASSQTTMPHEIVGYFFCPSRGDACH